MSHRIRESTNLLMLAMALVGAFNAGCGGGDAGSSTTPIADTLPPSAAPPLAPPACPSDLDLSDIHPSPESAPACDPASFETFNDLAYAPHARGVLDLMIPRAGASGLPLVIWIHGGGWQSGDKSNRAQATRLLCRGYAVAAVNYRLSGTDVFPAQINDIKAAIRYLRANSPAYGLDGSRFAAFGSSAGGHLAALAGTSADIVEFEDPALGNPGISTRVQATVDWYGPTHFPQMDSQLLLQGCPAGSAHHGDADSAESRVLGCTVSAADCAAAAQRADPSRYADASDAPMLLLHGTSDCTVPIAQSTLLHEHLVAAGACAIQRSVIGAGHGGPAWTSREVQEATADFLDRVLGAGD
jgi:acetyl esterase/lipase